VTDVVVADLIDRLVNEISISELIGKSGLGARAFRAAFRAIYSGKLNADTRELITTNSIVAPRRGDA
jgi:hypothetical protein